MRKLFAYILVIAGLIVIGIGVYLGTSQYMNEKKTEQRAADALIRMQEMIPERTYRRIYDDGKGSEMPVMEINGLSFVGYIEIPDAEITFALQNKWGDPSAAKLKEGNITYGTGVIETGQIPFDAVGLGTTVAFTDINGNVYEFVVDYVGNESDIVQNAKLILLDEGMSRVIQIACIEK